MYAGDCWIPEEPALPRRFKMRRSLIPVAAVLVLGLAACQDSGSPSDDTEAALTEAFATVPLGFGEVQSTFPNSTDSGTVAWSPGRPSTGFRDRGGMMCGGERGFLDLGLAFGIGRGFFRGELPDHCAFDATVGRVVCDTVTRHGLSIVRSAAFTDADGTVQEKFDSLTNTVNVKVDVSGTFARRDVFRTTVDHHSDRTVTGLGPGSTELTVSGTSNGKETTTGSNSRRTFTAERVVGDTINDVVLPLRSTAFPFPASGSIIRAMTVTVTYEGETPVTSSRREVITFDGTRLATVVITRNGVTKNCTLHLPTGRLVCE